MTGDTDTGAHYEQVAEFRHWLKIYDDTKLTTYFPDADEIRVYRAGEMGCIIQLVQNERVEFPEGSVSMGSYCVVGENARAAADYIDAQEARLLEVHGGQFFDNYEANMSKIRDEAAEQFGVSYRFTWEL